MMAKRARSRKLSLRIRGKDVRFDRGAKGGGTRSNLEPLEPRLLLSTVDLVGDVLTYTGAAAASSTLAVSYSGGTYSFTDTTDAITLGGSLPAGWTLVGNTASGPDTGVNSLQVSLGDLGDAANIESIGHQTIVNGSSGADTVNVAGTSHDLTGIAAQLTVNGDADGDALIINDQGNTAATAYTFTSALVSRDDGVNPVVQILPGQMEDLTLNTGSDDDTVAVNDTPADDVVLNTGAGDDTITVAAGAITTGHPLTLNAGDPAASDTLVYEDDAKVFVGETAGEGQVQDNALNLMVDFTGVELIQSSQTLIVDVAADEDASADTFTLGLDATGTNLLVGVNGSQVLAVEFLPVDAIEVIGSDDGDTLTVDVGNGVINRPIYFTAGAGSDDLVLQGDPGFTIARETYMPDASPGDGQILFDPDGNTGIYGGAQAYNGDEMPIMFTGLDPIYDTVPAAQLDIFATGVADTIFVEDGPGIGIFTTTLVQETSGPNFESIEFANKTLVTVNGWDGADAFTLDNSLPADGLDTLQLYGNELAGGSNADDGSGEAFSVDAIGAGAPPMRADLYGQDGDDDFFALSAAGLDDIGADVHVFGGAGNDVLGASDLSSAAVVGDTVTITSTQISGAAAGTFHYDDTLEVLYFQATENDDTINVESTEANTDTIVAGGSGNDTFNVTDAGSLAGIAGALTILPFDGAVVGDNDWLNVDASADAGSLTASIGDVGNQSHNLFNSSGETVDADMTRLSGFAAADIEYGPEDVSC